MSDKNLINIDEKGIQFQLECLTGELTEMIVEKYGWEIPTALDVLYNSETYRKISDPECEMYYQGAVYLFSFLQNEIETGKIA